MVAAAAAGNVAVAPALTFARERRAQAEEEEDRLSDGGGGTDGQTDKGQVQSVLVLKVRRRAAAEPISGIM